MTAPVGLGREPWDGDITDDDLTALALAADADAPLDPDAVPLDVFLGSLPPALPAWYMAPVGARHAGRWRGAVILAFVATLLAIEAVGLCSTYGQLPFH